MLSHQKEEEEEEEERLAIIFKTIFKLKSHFGTTFIPNYYYQILLNKEYSLPIFFNLANNNIRQFKNKL